jgi:hypothetical protein
VELQANYAEANTIRHQGCDEANDLTPQSPLAGTNCKR